MFVFVHVGCDKMANPSVLIAVSYINELQVLKINEKGLLVGAAVTIGRLEEKLLEVKESLPGNNNYCEELNILHVLYFRVKDQIF